MLCDNCKTNSATYHSKVNINGNVTETHLCSDCVKLRKKPTNTSDVLGAATPTSFLDGMLNDTASFTKPNLTAKNSNLELEPICDGCGAKYEEFLKNGFLSCSECYSAFYNKLLSVIKTMQHGVEHKGKTQKLDDGDVVMVKIRDLEFKLRQAVANENYELASELKKQIINLKTLEEGDKVW